MRHNNQRRRIDGIMFRLPILALTLTQDDSSGQHNGPQRGELIDAAVVRYEPGTPGNQRQVEPVPVTKRARGPPDRVEPDDAPAQGV